MFAHASELISRTDNTRVVRLFAKTLMSIAGGELHQDLSAYEYSQDTLAYFGRIEGKTASLFAASSEGGGIVAGCTQAECDALRAYGMNVGMAFQVVDDILDVEGSTAQLGKTAGKDAARGKPTYMTTLGLDAARERAAALRADAHAALLPFGARARRLAEIADWIALRRH
jgi:geranylgeranyl pyrophosphate synthase